MKTDRQKLILELISGQSVATQQQLLELLAARGVQCTQATLSRDIHALNLVKLSDPGGGIRYGVEPVSAVGNDVRKLLNIARLAALSIDAAGNIIVIKTMPGLAHAVGSFADKLEEQDRRQRHHPAHHPGQRLRPGAVPEPSGAAAGGKGHGRKTGRRDGRTIKIWRRTLYERF